MFWARRRGAVAKFCTQGCACIRKACVIFRGAYLERDAFGARCKKYKDYLMKPILTVGALGALAALAACDDATYSNNATNAANPAATFCIDQGHAYEIRENADGSQYGVCKFKGGGEQDAWEYFRANATGANPTFTDASSET